MADTPFVVVGIKLKRNDFLVWFALFVCVCFVFVLLLAGLVQGSKLCNPVLPKENLNS